MTVMGFQQSAFWLSQVLMYAGFIFIASIFMTLVIKLFQMVIFTGFMVVIMPFTLNGLSLIKLALLLCVLTKRPNLTGLVGSLFTVSWGCLGFTALYRQLQLSVGWALCLFNPFAHFKFNILYLLYLEFLLDFCIFSLMKFSTF